MAPRDDLDRLKDMLDAARSAVVAAQGRSRDDLAADPIWALGLVKCIEIVGEAAGRLSAEMRQRHTTIPWAQMTGMRNRLVHAYFAVDYEQVWRALAEDLPSLIPQLEQAISKESSVERTEAAEEGA